MGSNDVNVRMNADSMDAVSAWRAIIGAVRETQRSIERFTETASRGARRTERDFRQTRGAIYQVDNGIRILGRSFFLFEAGSRAVGLFKRELEDVLGLQERALQRRQPYEQAMMQLGFQLPKTADITLPEIDKMIQEAKTSVDPAVMANMVLGSISAGQATGERERAETAVSVATIRQDLRNMPGAMQAMAEAVLELKRQYPEYTPAQLIGTITAALTQARTSDPEKFSRQLATSAAEMKDYGLGLREAFAMTAAIGSTAGDVEGSITRTAAVNLMAQLIEKGGKFGVPKELMGMDLINFIRTDPGAGAAFQKFLIGPLIREAGQLEEESKWYDDESGESIRLITRAKTLKGLSDFLQSGENQTKRIFDEAMANILVGPEAELDIKERRKKMLEMPILQRERIAQETEAEVISRQMDIRVSTPEAIARSLFDIAQERRMGTIYRKIQLGIDLANLKQMGTQREMLEYEQKRRQMLDAFTDPNTGQVYPAYTRMKIGEEFLKRERNPAAYQEMLKRRRAEERAKGTIDGTWSGGVVEVRIVDVLDDVKIPVKPQEPTAPRAPEVPGAGTQEGAQ